MSSTGATSQTACVGGNTSPAGSTSSGQCVAVTTDTVFTTPGTYIWTAPSGVTSISVVAI